MKPGYYVLIGLLIGALITWLIMKPKGVTGDQLLKRIARNQISGKQNVCSAWGGIGAECPQDKTKVLYITPRGTCGCKDPEPVESAK